MTTKTVVSYETTAICGVKTVWTEEEANALLETGQYVLMHAGVAHKDVTGYQAKPVYVLGKLRKAVK